VAERFPGVPDAVGGLVIAKWDPGALPPLDVQKEIVAEIEGYQNEIERLEAEIANQEENIQRSIARVWGEDSESANGAPPSQPGATPPVSNPKHHEG
jgi:hypothetical protein